MKSYHIYTVILCAVFYLFTIELSVLSAQEAGRGLNVRIYDTGRGTYSNTQLYSGSYALLIGNANYRHWRKLHAVSNETMAVKSALEAHGFSIYGNKVWNDLTEEGLKDLFDDFIDAHGYDEQNRLVFYFAGHGHTINGVDGYLVPIDAPMPSDEKGFRQSAVGMSTVQVWMKDMTAKHALFLFDCCFAGTVFSSRSNSEIAIPSAITHLVAKKTRQIITAGDAGEEVPAKSVFSESLVNALNDPIADFNNDGYMTATELGQFIRQEVLEYTRPVNNVQFGYVRDLAASQGDVVFSFGGVGQGLAKGIAKTTPEPMVPAPVTRASGPPMEDFQNGVGMDMVWIASLGAWVGKYEVTQAAYEKVVGSNPSYFTGNSLPVQNVDWHDANAFCQKLTEKEVGAGKLSSGYAYLLPSDEDYSVYVGGTTLSDSVTSSSYKRSRPEPVGSKAANSFGLHDVRGNVWEWLKDKYQSSMNSASVRSQLSGLDSNGRVVRGGSYSSSGDAMLAIDTRASDKEYVSDKTVGFRVILRKMN